MNNKNNKINNKVACCEYNQIAVNHLLNIYYKYENNQKKIILKAIKSICMFPLPIETEKDALSLNGVGEYLSKEILKSFENKRKERNERIHSNTNSNNNNNSSSNSNNTSNESQQGIYKPEYGGGSWAIMIGLKSLNGKGTKKDILNCLEVHSIKVFHFISFHLFIVYLSFLDYFCFLG